MSTYTPDPAMQRYHVHTCQECGQLPDAHHTDGRCYTSDEIATRLRIFQRTGAWPAPDEGGVPVAPPPAPPDARLRAAAVAVVEAYCMYRADHRDMPLDALSDAVHALGAILKEEEVS